MSNHKRLLAFILAAILCFSLSACAQRDQNPDVNTVKTVETVSDSPIDTDPEETSVPSPTPDPTPEPTPEPTPVPQVNINRSTTYEDVYGTAVSLRDALCKAFQSIEGDQPEVFATVIESEMLSWVAEADQQSHGDGQFVSAVLSPGTRLVDEDFETFGYASAQYYRADDDYVNIEMEFEVYNGSDPDNPTLIYFTKVDVGILPEWSSVYSYNANDGPYEYVGNYSDSLLPLTANEDAEFIWNSMQMAMMRSWASEYYEPEPEPVQEELSLDELLGIWRLEMTSLISSWKKQENNGVEYRSQIDNTSYNTLFPNYEYSESMITIKTKVNYWYRYVGGDPSGYVNATVKIDKYTGEIISSYIG